LLGAPIAQDTAGAETASETSKSPPRTRLVGTPSVQPPEVSTCPVQVTPLVASASSAATASEPPASEGSTAPSSGTRPPEDSIESEAPARGVVPQNDHVFSKPGKVFCGLGKKLRAAPIAQDTAETASETSKSPTRRNLVGTHAVQLPEVSTCPVQVTPPVASTSSAATASEPLPGEGSTALSSGPPLEKSMELEAAAKGLVPQSDHLPHEKVEHPCIEHETCLAAAMVNAEQEFVGSEKPSKPKNSRAKAGNDASDPKRKKRRAQPSKPLFAFEFFRKERRLHDEGSQSVPMLELYAQWKELSDSQRSQYTKMAEEDRARFEDEYEEWRWRRATRGVEDVSVEECMDTRRTAFLQQITKLDQNVRKKWPRRFGPVHTSGDSEVSTGAPAHTREPAPRQRRERKARSDTDTDRPGKASRRRGCRSGTDTARVGRARSKGPPPQGFPSTPRSAYSFFCGEAKANEATTAALLVPPPAFSDSPPTAVPIAPVSAVLPLVGGDVDGEGTTQPGVEGVAERSRPLSAVGLRRLWCMLTEADQDMYKQMEKQDGQRFREELDAWCSEKPERLGEAAQFLGPSRQKPERSRPSSVLPPTTPGTFGEVLLRAHAAVRSKPQPKPRGDEQGVAKGDDAMMGALVPHGPPAVRKPDSMVDDLLGEFAEVEEARPPNEVFDDDERMHVEMMMDPPPMEWSDTPMAGMPRVLGPQLCLDESGNIVVNQATLFQDVQEAIPMDAGVVTESVTKYESAYRRSKPCSWTPQETQMFYDALSLYGTDLFLVQTSFRNKSASQIKSKYTKELKKYPERVAEALTSKAKPLTKDTFERLHGRIDTANHYKPPSSPMPGEEPEFDCPMGDHPNVGVPHSEAPRSPFYEEPEYTAEDESLTTDRLMDLFD